MLAPGSTSVAPSIPLAATSTLGRSPACGPSGLFMPCFLPVGFQCAPALAKPGGSQRPTEWTWTPWRPCGRPAAVMRKPIPPVVCQARTLPIVCPAASTSGIGGPPAGSRAVSQAVVMSNGRRRASLRIGFDLHENLSFSDLRARFGGELGDGAVERSGQRMLHLHCFEREQALSFGNLCTLRDVDRRHPARHRRFDLAVVHAVCGARAPRRQAELVRLPLG